MQGAVRVGDTWHEHLPGLIFQVSSESQIAVYLHMLLSVLHIRYNFLVFCLPVVGGYCPWPCLGSTRINHVSLCVTSSHYLLVESAVALYYNL